MLETQNQMKENKMNVSEIKNIWVVGSLRGCGNVEEFYRDQKDVRAVVVECTVTKKRYAIVGSSSEPVGSFCRIKRDNMQGGPSCYFLISKDQYGCETVFQVVAHIGVTTKELRAHGVKACYHFD